MLVPRWYYFHYPHFQLFPSFPKASQSTHLLRINREYNMQCRNAHSSGWDSRWKRLSPLPVPRVPDPNVQLIPQQYQVVSRLLTVFRFLPADALWNLAMAINVYLTIFHKYRTEQLKSLEWKYHVMCYGFPFVIAFTYPFISTSSKGKIYGPAIL